jgi:hypothetical protein
VPLYPPKIPRGLTQAHTQASVVRRWQLTTWTMIWPCRLIGRYQHFREMYCLHLRWLAQALKIETVCFSEALVSTYEPTWHHNSIIIFTTVINSNSHKVNTVLSQSHAPCYSRSNNKVYMLRTCKNNIILNFNVMFFINFQHYCMLCFQGCASCNKKIVDYNLLSVLLYLLSTSRRNTCAHF